MILVKKEIIYYSGGVNESNEHIKICVCMKNDLFRQTAQLMKFDDAFDYLMTKHDAHDVQHHIFIDWDNVYIPALRKEGGL